MAEQEAPPAGSPDGSLNSKSRAIGRIGSISVLLAGLVTALSLIILILHWSFGPNASDYRVKMAKDVEVYVDALSEEEGGYVSLNLSIANEEFDPLKVIPGWLRWLYEIDVYYSVQLGLQDGSASLGRCFSENDEWGINQVDWRFSADGNLKIPNDGTVALRVVECKTPAIITPNSHATYDVWIGTQINVSSKLLKLFELSGDKTASIAEKAQAQLKIKPDLRKVGEFKVVFNRAEVQADSEGHTSIKLVLDRTEALVGEVQVDYHVVNSPLRGERADYSDWFEKYYADMTDPRIVQKKIVSDFSDLMDIRPEDFTKMISLVTDFMARYSYGQQRPSSVILNDKYLKPDYICGSHFMFLTKELALHPMDAAALVFLFHHQTPAYFAYKKLGDGEYLCGNNDYEKVITHSKLPKLAESRGIPITVSEDGPHASRVMCNRIHSESGLCFVNIYKQFENAIFRSNTLDGLHGFMGAKVIVNLPQELDSDYTDAEGYGFTKIVKHMVGNGDSKTNRKIGCFRYWRGGGSPGVEFFWKNDSETVRLARIDVNSKLQITEITLRRATQQEIRSVYWGNRTFDEDTKCRKNFINHGSARRYLQLAKR